MIDKDDQSKFSFCL